MAIRGTPLERVAVKQLLARRQRRRNRLVLVCAVLTAVGVGLALTALPLFILIYGGMLPTLVAFLADEQPGRYLFRAVGFMNLAGIIPYIEPTLRAGNHAMLSGALAQTTTWVVIYVIAGSGFFFYFVMPWFAGLILELMIRARISRHAAERAALGQEWELDS